MKKIIIVLLVVVFAISCGHPNRKKIKYTEQVHCYQTKQNNNNDDIIFWYLIMCNQIGGQSTNTNYYYSSTSAVTDFSSVQFTKSESMPFDIKEATELPTEQIDSQQFSQEMQTEFSENAEYLSGQTEQENGDYEGTDNNSDNNSNSEGSESNSTDAGNGGDGGGDGGGE